MSKSTLKISRKQLAALTQDELFELAKNLQDVDSAARFTTLDTYLAGAHEGQLKFHKATKRIRLLLAGNRFGKSTCGVVEFIWRNQGTHPFVKTRVPIKSLIVAQDFENHVKNVIEPKIMQWSPEGAIIKVERTQQGALKKIFWSSGSTTDILSHDQSLKVFEGSDYDLCWFDEPPPRLIFNAVWRGCTDRGGSVYVTGTPIVEPWLYPKFLEGQNADDPLLWSMMGKTMDNVVNLGEGDAELGKKRVEELASMYEPEERGARLEGQFLQMHGLIFKAWSRAHHMIEPFPWPNEWPVWESIDPHPRKPWAVSWIGLTPTGNRILIRSGLYDGALEDVAASILMERTQIEMKIANKPLRIARGLIDNYASAPLINRSSVEPNSARRKIIRDELEDLIGPKAFGPRLECPPKDVSQKIDLFRQWLRVNKDGKSIFYAFNNQENEAFVNEIEGYVWDTKRGGLRAGLKDTPRKIDDDILDSIMQACMIMPNGQTETPKVIKTVRSHASYSSFAGGGF